jgi:Protein of unknown function (DUF1592)/Protein of unknown function (DUF1588)/Protein of unknown function (DUF1585)/Protein of unknown function (DUF1595)/Protein of unknown function (DUF1587)
MRALAAVAAALGVLLGLAGASGAARRPDTASMLTHPPRTTAPVASAPQVGFAAPRATALSPAGEISPEALTAVVRRVCGLCHNDQLRMGNLSLQSFDVAQAAAAPETTEKMIAKLQAGMMPPPGIPRPAGDTMRALVQTLETLVDEAAADRPNPGDRPFQRLNRPEYERSIRALLALDVNAGDYLPLDTKSANFDNIADVQLLSPTLLDAYLHAAAEISRLAVGDRNATPSEATYEKPGYYSQWDRVEGAPFGTRGGITTVHNFPADGEYVFRMAFDHTTTGGYYGSTARFEQVEISIDGARAVLLDMDQWMHVSDPNGVNMETEPIFVRAGPRRVSAAFIRQAEGPVEDLTSPHEWSLADRQIGAGGYGITALPHLKELVVAGPYRVTGVSETPSRREIFSCRPTTPAEEEPCAAAILARLGAQAYRRSLTQADVRDLMAFYEDGVAAGGFENGIRTALQAILASPDFVFRYEPAAAGRIEAGRSYRISDAALASRLSFFLWGAPPDEELAALAEEGKLSGALEPQVRRMLADPRAEALATRFAAQWLRLQDLDKVHPDAFWFPDFDQQLADAMRRETELFFHSLVREDRSVLDLFRADYTFVNDRLARHYGIPDVTGTHFRRVSYPDDRRRGLLGHGSILTLTSHANRTSPVLRGKWVMEVLLGTPPPPPPPGIPDLEETEGAKDGRLLTTRERMELHRSNAMCRSCHQFMDPIGLALDNFDVTGKWRIRENGMPLDTRGELYDGTPLETPDDLRRALLARPIPLIRTFTENLMAYALGRRVEHFDKPTVRAIAAEAEANDYRMSSFILGIIESDAFRMKREEAVDPGGDVER